MEELVKKATRGSIRYAVGRALLMWMWASVIAIPIYGPIMPRVEGFLLPVISDIIVYPPTRTWTGWEVQYDYQKSRDCEYLSSQATKFGVIVPFYPVNGSTPTTKLTGYQHSQLWYIGVRDLRGVSLTFIHRCNPLWITITTPKVHFAD